MSTKYVYLAGPILGQTYHAARYGWRREFDALMPDHIRVLNPMRQEGHLAEVVGVMTTITDTTMFGNAKAIFFKDVMDIKRADVVVVNLYAEQISRGTLVEIGLAYGFGVPIVVVMQDGNCHDHPFVREPALAVVKTVQDAAFLVEGLLSDGL